VTQPAGTWASARAYEAYVGRWSRAVAALAVPALGVAPRSRWVDVGCGTGVVAGAVLEEAAPRLLVGVDSSAAFLAAAADRVRDPRAAFVAGDAAALPVGDATADAVVSGLVLNSLPDPRAALAEWRRVLRPGGALGLYVWDHAEGMQMMRVLWDAAAELDPAAADLDEGRRSVWCRPGPLRRLAESAGFEGVDVGAVDVPTVFRDVDDFWQPFLGGTGPAPAYVTGLAPDAREELRALVARRLHRRPDGSIPLIARAWLVLGRA
jgi:SAM-dependent methyltransferase